MAVISVTLTESAEQIMSGIPRYISVTTNIACTIFYTFDGTNPTIFSDIYIDELETPTDRTVLTFKVLATDGIDTCTVTEEYYTNMLDNTRLPRSATDAQAESSIPSLYPFGTNCPQPNANYLNPGDAGITVDDPDLTQIPSGFDAYGNPAGFTNEAYNLENYNIKYSTTNTINQTGIGIGNLPAEVTDTTKQADPIETDVSDNDFNPRAKVTFYDQSKAKPGDPPFINRNYFILQDVNKTNDANNLFSCGLDAPTVSGSYVRCVYNPSDNTDNFYFWDSLANRWIITKAVHNPAGDFDGNLSGIQSSREPGSRFVHQHVPFARRTLF